MFAQFAESAILAQISNKMGSKMKTDSLRNIGSGTGSTQPCEDILGGTWQNSSGCGLEN
jgi:hypothetical protein